MSGYRGHSLILAAEFPVDDVDDMWNLLVDRELEFADIGAHHLVVYKSMWGRRRVLLTVGIRQPDSIPEVLRSRAVFDLFDVSGVDEIPAIFAGRMEEKVVITADPPESVPGVIVGVVTRVDEVSALIEGVHAAADRFESAGVRKVWVYSACDDSREVMILQELDNEVSARRWLNHPDIAAGWMTGAGFGVSATLFVGALAHVMPVRERVS